jgi:hypothetical protein
MNKELTKKIALHELERLFQQNPFVLFGTGTSCAVDARFGMGALRDHLLEEVGRRQLNTVQKTQWEAVASLLNSGNDLESAMEEVRDHELTDIIIESTVNLVAGLDKEYGFRILSGECEWPALSFFEKLVNGLSINDKVLHVATTNYDLLAEYAFEKAKIPYITGFSGGISRRRNWEQAIRYVTYCDYTYNGRKLYPAKKVEKHIRLYKVHGSLNLFSVNSNIMEINTLMYDNYIKWKRIMITPGTAKYERLHEYRSELLGEYDQAINKHKFFLFIGFGFNDNQLINESVNRKLKEIGCSGLIITRDSNPKIEKYVRECKNLWIVCGSKAGNVNDTRIYNSRYSNEIIFKETQMWDPIVFTKLILGG